MALTGKTGADAIFKALKRICLVLASYSSKLDQVISAAETNGDITAAQAVTARAFVGSALGACAVFELIANYSGFDTNP